MKVQTIIASAFRATNTLAENYRLQQQAINYLRANGLDYQQGIGSYKEEGQERASLESCVIISLDEHRAGLLTGNIKALFLERFKQDAILVIDEMKGRLASLAFSDGTSQELGTYQEVSKAEATETDCFTYSLGRYYQAKEVETIEPWDFARRDSALDVAGYESLLIESDSSYAASAEV